MNARDLQQAALAAHHAGESWTEFHAEHGEAMRRAEPFDRRRFHKLVDRLLALVVSGDLDGMTAVGDDAPWERDDAADRGLGEVSDTETRATLQGVFWDTAEPYV